MSIQSRHSFVVQAGTDRDSASPREADLPTTHDYQLLLERRSAQADGYELPLDSEEAAAYIGSSLSRVISLAFTGEIPAHPIAGGAWIFYVSELEEWLDSKANKVGDPSPTYWAVNERNRT